MLKIDSELFELEKKYGEYQMNNNQMSSSIYDDSQVPNHEE